MPRKTTRHMKLTPEAFRELAESALLEMYENADTLELHDLRTWQRKLLGAVDSVASYELSAGADLDDCREVRFAEEN